MSTATVETLTAEVRVLMVGNRQVTLSVAKQLDEVHPAEITPMGRIRLGRDDWERTANARGPVIGSANDGALVRCELQKPPDRLFVREDTPAQAFATWCCEGHLHNSNTYRDSIGDVWLPQRLRKSERDWCDGEARIVYISPCLAELTGNLWADRGIRYEAWRTARNLPLIVLAGLR